MPGPPALRRGGEKLYVKKKEGMWLGGETPGCILARFELSETTSEKHGENSILYQTDGMFLGNNDHNLNNVPVFKLSAGSARLWNETKRFVQMVYKWVLTFVPVKKKEKRTKELITHEVSLASFSAREIAVGSRSKARTLTSGTILSIALVWPPPPNVMSRTTYMRERQKTTHSLHTGASYTLLIITLLSSQC